MYYLLPDFRFVKPETLREAFRELETEGAAPIAGGTDLVIDMKVGRRKPDKLVYIAHLPELNGIKDAGDSIVIGAVTKLQSIVDSDLLRKYAPVLPEAVNEMASWQIRNIATIGGNLGNASPAADTAPPLYVLDAKVVIKGLGTERVMPVKEFFVGPKRNALRKGELIQAIIVPKITGEGVGMSYVKIGRRQAFTLSIVSVATLVKVEGNEIVDARVALNAVAPTPVRAPHVEEALKGSKATAEAVMKAAEEVLKDISPISDVRASKEYRRLLSVALTRESLLTSLRRAGVKVEV